jgi:translation initiation factor 3 subunit K
MTTLDGMRTKVSGMLKGIERYNPENIQSLERYVDMQAKEQDGCDLEANLTLLKLYQFNPQYFSLPITAQILLKALTNLPDSDFIQCKSLLNQENLDEGIIVNIQFLSDLLEKCQFKAFWNKVHAMGELVRCVSGFEDSVRKFVCHVISITYQRILEETLCEQLGLVDENAVNQWIAKNGWKTDDSGYVMISNQEEQIKTKKITEKIDMDSVAGIMASCY